MNDSLSSTLERRIAVGLTWVSTCALALAGLYPGNNPDTFGHLAQGRQIVELGRVPQFDTWSLLPGPARAWHNYEWLSDLLFYGLYAGFGYDGLLAFKCALLGITCLALLSFARRLGGDHAVAFSALVLVSTIPVARIRFSDRPHVLGLCLAAFYFVALSRLIDCAPTEKRLRRKLIVSMFAMHVLWVNLHGSHLLGVAITGAFLVLSPRENRRALLTVLTLEGIASCISPYGPHIVTDALKHVFDPRYRALVTEWMAWSENDPPWLQLGPAMQAAVLTVMAPRLLRASASARAGLLICLLTAIASFRSIRFVAEFMLLSAPLVGTGIALAVRGSSPKLLIRIFAIGPLILLPAVAWGASTLPPFMGIGHGISVFERPHGPGVLLASLGPEARVFGSIETNWYLMWEAPRARYIVDGRVPFYGPEFVTEIGVAFQDPHALDATLRQYDITAVVLKHSLARDHHLVPLLQARAGWSLALIDDAFVLFVRDDMRDLAPLPVFSELKPEFGSDWVLRATAEKRSAIARELALLAAYPTSDGYRLWVQALLALAPFRIPYEATALRWPASREEKARYDEALHYLKQAEPSIGDIPVVASTEALVAAIACDLASSERALERAALYGAPGREAVLARQELALRQGHDQEVAAFVRAARGLAGGREDPALTQLLNTGDARFTCTIAP